MIDWNKAIDTKTQIALGLNLAMLGGLVAMSPKPDDLTFRMLVLLAIGGILPFLSCVQCMRGFFPQTKGPGDSLIFFGAIDNRTVDGYRKAICEETDETYASDLCEQVYRNAQIATSKYRLVKNAILLQAMGVIPWLIASYVLYKGF
ncbi:MAG: hypothetical protein HND42_05010 [Armatimonadetes bacterium]|nr:hypothetical protein [Armatimonadota bacterium]